MTYHTRHFLTLSLSVAFINYAAMAVEAATNTGSGSTGGYSGNTTATTGSTSGSVGVTGSVAGNSGTASTNSSMQTNSSNWSSENDYWRSQYPSRPYYKSGTNYSMYEPAYQFGVNTYNQNSSTRYSDLDQARLKADWERARGTSTLSWEQAQPAMRDAYDRLYNSHNTSASR